LLDQRGILYELREYEVDANDLAAETVAAKIGLPPEQVFKTLVARGDRNGACMAAIPGDQERDLKALATARRRKKDSACAGKGIAGADGLRPWRRDRSGCHARLSRLR
jgi:Cys-tRNA(Pro)/Cys-tRNA(Cys) deacylase